MSDEREETGEHNHGHGGHGHGHWTYGGMSREGIKDDVIRLMDLKSTDVVADLGSGDGFYSSKFAEICEKVYAIDEYSESFRSEFYDNPKIVTMNADVCERLELSGITRVFFSNSFHDMECQEKLLDVITEILPKGGRITMIEFKPDTPFGPPRNIRFSEEDLVNKIEAHGFRKVGSIDLKGHYAVSFEKT